MPNSVLCEVVDGLATVTINRPDKLNALDYGTIDTLLAVLDALEVDGSVGVVALTGAGERAFCAGGDIPQFAESIRAGVEAGLREFLRRGQRLTARIEGFPKPVIVAVNGLAYGAGCEITEAAPLAVASERASFCKPEIRLGFPPTFGGTQRLPRLVGRKRAAEMILTARPVDAARALEIGLVNRVVPHAELTGAVRALADEIIDKSPLAVAACLTAVTRGLNVSIDEGLAIEASQFARMIPTSDIREGIGAFIEKRRAVFAGR